MTDDELMTGSRNVRKCA